MKKIAQKGNKRKGYIKVPQGLPISQGQNSKAEAAYDWMYLSGIGQLPSQRKLSRRWGWTLHKTRQFIEYMNNFNQSSITFQSGRTGYTGNVEDVSITSQSLVNHSPSTPSDSTDVSVPLNQYIIIGGDGIKYACEEVDRNLFRYINASAHCRALLEAWINHYKGAGHTVECILAKDMGVCSSVTRQGNLEGALLILDWLFNCHRSRPKYLRENGMLHIWNVCHKKVYAENYSLASAWKSDSNKTVEKSTPTTTTTQPEPRYDSRGFLIQDKGV